jgi:hypothetical protein
MLQNLFTEKQSLFKNPGYLFTLLHVSGLIAQDNLQPYASFVKSLEPVIFSHQDRCFPVLLNVYES